jgi:NMD protein affecting ribosome stability and mRNA decay
MTKQICIRCGKSYTDLRVFVISSDPGLCPDCQRGAVKSVINKLFGSK